LFNAFFSNRLYKVSSLVYPPQFDEWKDQEGVGAGAIILQSSIVSKLSIVKTAANLNTFAEALPASVVAERMKTLQSSLSSIVNRDAGHEDEAPHQGLYQTEHWMTALHYSKLWFGTVGFRRGG
jgi:hypothetical protein